MSFKERVQNELSSFLACQADYSARTILRFHQSNMRAVLALASTASSAIFSNIPSFGFGEGLMQSYSLPRSAGRKYNFASLKGWVHYRLLGLDGCFTAGFPDVGGLTIITSPREVTEALNSSLPPSSVTKAPFMDHTPLPSGPSGS
jgi:hypothetical protein